MSTPVPESLTRKQALPRWNLDEVALGRALRQAQLNPAIESLNRDAIAKLDKILKPSETAQLPQSQEEAAIEVAESAQPEHAGERIEPSERLSQLYAQGIGSLAAGYGQQATASIRAAIEIGAIEGIKQGLNAVAVSHQSSQSDFNAAIASLAQTVQDIARNVHDSATFDSSKA